MSETQSAPPPAEAPATTVPESASPPPETQDSGAEPAPKPAEPPEWVSKRIARYTYGMKEAERQRDQERAERQRVEAELAVYRRSAEGQAQAPVEPPQQAQAPAPAQDRVRAEAQQAAYWQTFNTETNAMIDKARAHGDIDASVSGWRAAGLNIDSNPGHRDIIGLLNSLPDGPELFYRIGSDPALAEHIANLSPTRAAYEIRGLSSSTPGTASPAVEAMAAPGSRPAVSSAPRPPTQPAARGTSASSRSLNDPNLTMEDYVRLRAKRS